MKHCLYKYALCIFSTVILLNNVNAQTTATVHSNNTTCGLTNGTAQVYPTGGSGYTYRWSSGGSLTDTITNLPSGNYTVTVYGTPISDSVVKIFTIAPSTQPALSITARRDTICLGSSDELKATGATPGGYTWSGTTFAGTINADSISVSTLNAGSYSYTVTWGAPACPASASYTILAGPVTAGLNTTVNPSCGRNNGSISCNVASYNSVNIFLRNDTIVQRGSGTQLINAGPGTYTFIVNDLSTGCTDTVKNIILTDTSSVPSFSSISVVPEKCFGNKKGAIHVTVSNCSSGCTYSWSQNATDHTDSAINLPAGIDTFYVSKGGCVNIDTIIHVPGPLSALSDSVRIHPDHCGHNIGSAMAITKGGTQPFIYSWSMGIGAGDTVSHLSGDSTLILAVTDSSGCVDTVRKFISTTHGPRAVMSKADTICMSESNGVLVVTPSGIGPFTYHWSNGKTTNVDAGLPPASYTVTVTDAVGCDTILHSVVPYYSAYLYADVQPSRSITRGQTILIDLRTNVPVADVIWDPYVPGSRGNTSVSDKPSQNTQYTVILTYGLSCQLHDTIEVSVYSDTANLFSIPNTFTPNNDGINDNFKLLTYPALGSFHIWIFDRWGGKVYESTDPEFNWDGRNQYTGNSDLNTGVYAYVIEYQPFNSDSKKVIGGNISLIK